MSAPDGKCVSITSDSDNAKFGVGDVDALNYRQDSSMKCVKTKSFEVVRETAVASDAGNDNDFLISEAKFLESQVD